MIDLDLIKKWIEVEYNSYAEVFISTEGNECVRFTSESGDWYIDIYSEGSFFVLSGERNGETIQKSVQGNRESLIEELANI